MRQIFRFLVVASMAAVVVSGCAKKEEKKAEDKAMPHGQGAAPGTAKKESVVSVPENVKGKWKAVKIAVTDKSTNKEAVYTVAIGSEFAIPGSDLAIKVDNFLPHFTMDGTTLTSQSNDPKNPAAQIRIMEGGKEVFKGWLFSLYPTTHAFNHPKYGFTLVDFVPAS